ncbi:hypothetical protein ACFT2C_04775 [Promicromonospora sp. NPDC057138]|uniref:hypothetical protein n=1 Tax=Promicromonospora sp. NPDC057138 TaxID=3346031 RepID=UPI00363E622A
MMDDDAILSVRRRADVRAVADHTQTDASAAHAMVGFRIWRALRALGAVHGRMLVTGVDAHEFARLPRERVQAWDSDGIGILVADIPPEGPGAFDDDGPVEESLVDEPGSVYDVVIHNAHLADVTFHDPGLREHLLQSHYLNLLTGLSRTIPGGFLVALMPRDVLDDPRYVVREAITTLGDVLGAVRLPDGALRNIAGCDTPTDLILVRRRLDDETPIQTTFLQVAHLLPAGDSRDHEHLNEHFVEYPERVLGTIGARPMPGGPPRLSVRASGRPLGDELRGALHQIVRSARRRNLTAGPGARTPVDRPPRQPHQPERPRPQEPDIGL